MGWTKSWLRQPASHLEETLDPRTGTSRIAARDWVLRGQAQGTGKRFREAVQESFALILRFPAGGAPGPAGTRKTKVKGFPFTVVYRDEPSQIVVFAIAPDRQQPGYWLPRAR